MRFCDRPLTLAKNGKSRGSCCRPHLHGGPCGGSQTCNFCADPLTPQNAAPFVWKRGAGYCNSCQNKYIKKKRNRPLNVVSLGEFHCFPCGCSGFIPETYMDTNSFVVGGSKGWSCRVSYILASSQCAAKSGGYVPIPRDTPHSVIRALMAIPECERCHEPLSWIFGRSKTPHLHHSHETGEIYGFTHPRCNLYALENEILRLRNLLQNKTY